jgi:hypothetical protein
MIVFRDDAPINFESDDQWSPKGKRAHLHHINTVMEITF